jgi:hypothetical protein
MPVTLWFLGERGGGAASLLTGWCLWLACIVQHRPIGKLAVSHNDGGEAACASLTAS